MYTIYHIPGVKVGCTGRDPQNRVNEQGHTSFKVLDVLDSLELASERELYWQEKLGYNKDNTSYEVLYSQGFLRPEVKAKAANSKKKPILQFDKQGNFIKEWLSAKDAGNVLNLYSTNITACCLGKIKTVGKFIWKFKN
jgi:hypothetical protein